MIDKATIEGKEDPSKPVWTPPVIDVFDAKDAEAGNDVYGEGGTTS